ncbi:hypothetical protein [Labrenzia sp. 011]|uniref:hypothetical protein n=1 Tax=Labrenzia sp. 011 TaxID=2171494 RepID=UPI001056F068|nr:hypothetical protein [Labrenzia sp. 011]
MRLFKPVLTALCAGILAQGLIHQPVHAQETRDQTDGAAITLELNKAEDIGGNCRLSFVMTNGTGQAVEAAAYELVLFSPDGVISQMSVFDFGALPAGKTVVRQFELPGPECAQAGRLLINGPAGCAPKAASAHCSAPLKLSSRIGLTLTQ